jgi:hypothetical protein
MPNIRRFLSLLLASLLLTFTLQASGDTPAPMRMPFIVSFSYWQNHWFLWTPQHPVYESLEVMTCEDPARPGHPLVWAFFTERGGAKHQVHYVNEQKVAKNWSGEAYYRPMQYKVTERSNGARDIKIEFTDKDGQKVHFSANFSQSSPLTTARAGLTNQIGHDADSFFLIFFREKNTTTKTLQLLIGGKDYSFQENGQTQSFGFHAAYSRNIYVATINYGHFTVTDTNRTRSNVSDGEVFRWSAANTKWMGDENALGSHADIFQDAEGRMRKYVCSSYGHAFRIEFNPALATVGTQAMHYAISLDDFPNVVTGMVTTEQQGDNLVYRWRPETPEWAATIPYRSTLSPGQHGYTVAVTRER